MPIKAMVDTAMTAVTAYNKCQHEVSYRLGEMMPYPIPVRSMSGDGNVGSSAIVAVRIHVESVVSHFRSTHLMAVQIASAAQ